MCYSYSLGFLLLPSVKDKVGVFPSRKQVSATRPSRVCFPPGASRLVAEAFDAVPTTFGRLVLAACLLHRDIGLYVCPLASIAYGYKEVSLLLEETHHKLLSKWLAMTADQQVLDTQSYLSTVDNDSSALAASILRQRYYGALLPMDVDASSRKNFMKAVGHALKAHHGTPRASVKGFRS
jgi:hypothetical protein